MKRTRQRCVVGNINQDFWNIHYNFTKCIRRLTSWEVSITLTWKDIGVSSIVAMVSLFPSVKKHHTVLIYLYNLNIYSFCILILCTLLTHNYLLPCSMPTILCGLFLHLKCVITHLSQNNAFTGLLWASAENQRKSNNLFSSYLLR